MKNRKRRSNKLYDFAAMAIIFALILFLIVISGCAGGQARVREYDEAGNLTRTIVIDPYVLGRDYTNKGGELWFEVDGTIVYWLVLGDYHESKVSPENAKMIKEAIKVVSPLGVVQP